MPSSVTVMGAFVSGLVLSLIGGCYYVLFAQHGAGPVVEVQQEDQSPIKAQPDIGPEPAVIGIPEAIPATKAQPVKRSSTEILPPTPKATWIRPLDRAHTWSMRRPLEPQRSEAPNVQNAQRSAVSPQVHTIAIPSGTNITVRLIEPLGTGCNYIGDTFWAALDVPIVISGVTIADRGAKVSGTIIKESAGGRLGGAEAERLTLTEIATTEGQSLHIATNQHLRVTSCGTGVHAMTLGERAIPENIIGAISESRRPGGHAVRVESPTFTYETRLMFTVLSPVILSTKSGGERSK